MSITTKFWTLAELVDEVQDDLDLYDGGIVDPEGLRKFANRAIDRAEQLVHTIYEDYFLTKGNITLVKDQEEYEPPTDIYASKIRGLVYANGSTIYEIKQIRDPHKFMRYRLDRYHNSHTDGDYRYFTVNTAPGQWRILLTPPAQIPGEFVEIWYLRQANRLCCNEDILDVPEASNFVIAYMKYRAIAKDRRGNPSPELEDAKAEVGKEETELVATLTAMIADGDNEIPLDLSHYREHV